MPSQDPPPDVPDVLAAALGYAARGWRVLPIKPGEKRPPMSAWQNAATTDPATITAWFTGLYRGHGVGIATGRASGLWVLDVDVSDGKAGDETLHDLELSYGPLPDTVTATTGSGGRHIFFLPPDGFEIRNSASAKLGPGLDVRGEGGQIVAAPTVHPSGQPYAWEDGHGPDETVVVEAPKWLLHLLRPPDPLEAAPAKADPFLDAVGDSIAEHVTQAHRWHDLLLADGWQRHSDANGDTMWTRPGKDVRAGASAVLHEPSGPLVVFTSSVAALQQPWATVKDGAGWAYGIFGYLAATRHDGDRSECARAYREALNNAQAAQVVTMTSGQQAHAVLMGEDDRTPNHVKIAHLVDWESFWTKDHADEEWLAYPVIPAGRTIALYAPAKAGKSTVVLAVAAAAATGRKVLGQWTADNPVRTLYLDYEMTEADLWERLTELGYGHDDDMSHLHYALLPSLPPLDTPPGADALIALATDLDVELVVVDTFGRAVEGDENDADTVRDFYRLSGRPLKQAGISVARTDHSGKDIAKGQRGSSAKNDDVDVVWQLARTEGGVVMTRTHSRVSWVPETVTIRRDERSDGVVEYLVDPASKVYPAGTKEAADVLDAIGVPVDCSRRTAQKMLSEAGRGLRTKVLSAALAWRRERLPDPFGAVDNLGISGSRNPGTTPTEPDGNHQREPREPPEEKWF